MLALALLLLAALAAPAPSADASAPARVETVATGDACCDGEADVPDPCGPDEPCPASGGCTACVACCKRGAEAPPVLTPDATEDATSHAVPPGDRDGIGEAGAVWHPPRA